MDHVAQWNSLWGHFRISLTDFDLANVKGSIARLLELYSRNRSTIQEVVSVYNSIPLPDLIRSLRGTYSLIFLFVSLWEDLCFHGKMPDVSRNSMKNGSPTHNTPHYAYPFILYHDHSESLNKSRTILSIS